MQCSSRAYKEIIAIHGEIYVEFIYNIYITIKHNVEYICTYIYIYAMPYMCTYAIVLAIYWELHVGCAGDL